MNNRDYFNSEANRNRDKWMYSDGGGNAGGGIQNHSTANYTIQIVNSGPAVANVDIGDSYTNRTAQNFGQDPHITITSTVSGVSYTEFLSQSEAQPFTVIQTMIISTSAGQLDQTIALTHRNASGDRADHVITPTVDPYQNQTDRIIDSYEYMFDGMSRARFNQINANATVTIRMYLKNKFAASQTLYGRPAEQGYGRPDVVRPAWRG
jgi:hypothetical protein